MGLPRLLASDVGCIDSNSIVTTSLGIFFQSERGLELLNRSQQVEFVGEPVWLTTTAFPVVSAAVLDDRNSLVRFSMAESEADGFVSGDGVDLVFDLSVRAWVSVDQKRGSTASQPAQSACVVQYDDAWRYAWLGADGFLYVERDADDPSAYLDGTSWVTAEYETAPFKVGLQAEQRVYEMELLFERYSAAGLEIEAANDYGAYSAVTADKAWTDAYLSGLNQVSFRPKPRGMSVQLRVRDVAPVSLGNGRGFTFVGISADVAAEQRLTRGTHRIAGGARR